VKTLAQRDVPEIKRHSPVAAIARQPTISVRPGTARHALHLPALQPDPELPGLLQPGPACVLPERPHEPGGPGRRQHLGTAGCLPM